MKRFTAVILIALLVAASAALAGWIKYTPSPTNKDINAVDFLALDDGWAVGFWGEILHYTAGRWNINFTWPTQYFQDVDFSTPDFGFAVGYQGTTVRFNGTSWVTNHVPSGTYSMFAVGIPVGSTSTAWACGEHGELWKWSGGNWTKTTLGTTRTLHDIYWSSGTDGWICGDAGTVYHYTGTSWSAVSAFTSYNFYCIYALAPTNVWVGGSGGRLYHYEGIQWTQVTTPTSTAIREMAFNGPTDGWAVCDGGIVIKYDGITWKTVATTPTTTENFSGVNFVDGTSGWAVGTNGTIYEYRNFPAVEPSSLGRIKATLK